MVAFSELPNRSSTSPTQLIIEQLRNRKYDFRDYYYPENLGADSVGLGHFMLFNINVSNGVTVEKSGARPIDNTDNLDYFGDILRDDFNTPVNQSNPQQPKAEIGAQRSTKRITRAIALYMPDNITTTYSTNWEGGEIQAPVALIKTGRTIAGGLQDLLNNYDKDIINKISSEAGKFSLSQLSQYGLDFVQGSLGNSEVANAAALFRRQFRNPYMDFLFRGINPRTFNLNFKFMPSNQNETNKVRDIIKEFKKHALPEVTNQGSVFGMFYKYPSEFDITFFSAYSQNSYLYRFSTCALSNIEVNYTAGGQWSAFREIETQGAPPTHIELSLTFTELELMSSNRIEEGF